MYNTHGNEYREEEEDVRMTIGYPLKYLLMLFDAKKVIKLVANLLFWDSDFRHTFDVLEFPCLIMSPSIVLFVN